MLRPLSTPQYTLHFALVVPRVPVHALTLAQMIQFKSLSRKVREHRAMAHTAHVGYDAVSNEARLELR